jgi:hypothetical protein
MNCDELAATLGRTLIRDRDPRWFHEARRHAEGCPSCARLLELHRVEEHLTELSVVEPSHQLLETVMSRVTQRRPAAVPSSRGFSYESLRYAAIYIGALILAAAYLFPADGQSWLSNLWLAPGFFRTLGFSAYLSQHPLWAIYLAGLAALLIVLGLAIPEGPAPEHVRRA